MTQMTSFSTLTDRDLIAEVKRLAQTERGATAALVASLAEMDARKLYLGEGCSSLFTYCTRVLHLSEHAAYGRIEAARAARRFPVVLERLKSGEQDQHDERSPLPRVGDDDAPQRQPVAGEERKPTASNQRDEPVLSGLILNLDSAWLPGALRHRFHRRGNNDCISWNTIAHQLILYGGSVVGATDNTKEARRPIRIGRRHSDGLVRDAR